jgi:hypothetical protein
MASSRPSSLRVRGRSLERRAGDHHRGGAAAVLGEGAEVGVGHQHGARAHQGHGRDDGEQHPAGEAARGNLFELQRIEEHGERLEGRALDELDRRLAGEHVLGDRRGPEEGDREDHQAHRAAVVEHGRAHAGGEEEQRDQRSEDEAAEGERARQLGEAAEVVRLDRARIVVEGADQAAVLPEHGEREDERRAEGEQGQQRADGEHAGRHLPGEADQARREEGHDQEGHQAHQRLAGEDALGEAGDAALHDDAGGSFGPGTGG